VLEVRTALPSEYDAAGDLVADLYVAEGWAESPEYVAELRDARTRAAHTDLLVAVLDGTLVACVTLVLDGGPYAEDNEPGDAVIRMLATAPEARGQGVGARLVEECVVRSRAAGRTAVRLATQQKMLAAQRLYERAGFVRTPERDWAPVPDLDLLTYWLPLVYCGQCGEPGTHPDCVRMLELEPPRYCTQCRRRMVVQVHPTGWSARCVEHGTVTG
jgi:ribosomal protein S18 acetylase RimI-like enzyme